MEEGIRCVPICGRECVSVNSHDMHAPVEAGVVIAGCTAVCVIPHSYCPHQICLNDVGKDCFSKCQYIPASSKASASAVTWLAGKEEGGCPQEVETFRKIFQGCLGFQIVKDFKVAEGLRVFRVLGCFVFFNFVGQCLLQNTYATIFMQQDLSLGQ